MKHSLGLYVIGLFGIFVIVFIFFSCKTTTRTQNNSASIKTTKVTLDDKAALHRSLVSACVDHKSDCPDGLRTILKRILDANELTKKTSNKGFTVDELFNSCVLQKSPCLGAYRAAILRRLDSALESEKLKKEAEEALQKKPTITPTPTPTTTNTSNKSNTDDQSVDNSSNNETTDSTCDRSSSYFYYDWECRCTEGNFYYSQCNKNEEETEE